MQKFHAINNSLSTRPGDVEWLFIYFSIESVLVERGMWESDLWVTFEPMLWSDDDDEM